MAASLGRVCGSGLLKASNGALFNQVSTFSTARDWAKGRKTLLACLGVATGGAGALVYALESSVKAEGVELHAPNYAWDFYGHLSSFDHASLRRGWEVYKNVCSSCHSLKYVAFRELIGVTHTEAEVKEMAAEYEIKDGPNDQGEYYMRPGKPSDYVPSPYPNEEAARAANNGAYPPDLTYIVNARHNGENYIFSLLTGYCDPPAGVVLMDGQYYNPYFPGGAIGMAQVIYDEVLDFEDGTPATASQVAKDVVSFLTWASNPEFDTRKRWFIKAVGIFTLLLTVTYYMKRHRWSTIKSRKIVFAPKK
ncbi:cytochrome c1, heme protein, mitochondrial [Neodiprion pinetum]|uniref:Cytochrome c1, heme protein, mitochondrial n=1 Tax=Neodiprion lecontei TaxID=441921 RepID=A0A6J0BNX1_NEOLC|nr:cytochrome c1, heme protein, mitochondrial [Neodiprion lecontei]XP_046492154.1 cytochrome c1, heme protein, mitochondrial-like [Neodiprion pinetum]